MNRFEYQGTLHACGAELPFELPGGWQFAGAYVRQGEDSPTTNGRRWTDEPKPFLLATWRRPVGRVLQDEATTYDT